MDFSLPPLPGGVFQEPPKELAAEKYAREHGKRESTTTERTYKDLLGQELACFKDVAPKSDTHGDLMTRMHAHFGAEEKKVLEKATQPATEVLTNSLQILLLYFSSTWCPLCAEFDERLKDVFHGTNGIKSQIAAGKIAGHDGFPRLSGCVELVFVSCDVTETSFDAHLKSLEPINGVEWVPKRLDEVQRHFNAEAVPVLLIVDASDGHVLSSSGKEDIHDRCYATGRRTMTGEIRQKDVACTDILKHWFGLLEHRAKALKKAKKRDSQRRSVSGQMSRSGSQASVR